MPAVRTDPVARIAGLAARVDEEFESIRRRQAAWMQCAPGCSDCCRARLSVTRVEEAFLRRGLALMPGSNRAELVRRTHEKGRKMCPALDPDGRCGVYESRPLICRSYGVPLRRSREVELVNPPTIDVCDKNFADTPLKMLPTADVFDQTALETEVTRIDADYCERNGLPQGERVSIASILASLGPSGRPPNPD